MNKKRKSNYLTKNKGITLIALIVTIIVLIILAGISINLILGENGLIERAKQANKMQMKAQMKETLILAIQELHIEKVGNATLDDVTQEWIEKTITEYTCTITEDASIQGKKVTMQKDGHKAKFLIDEKLNIIEIQDEGIGFSYEAKSRDGDNVNIVITIENYGNEIKEIIYPDGNKITTNGQNEIQINYAVELGKEYKFVIVTNNGEQKEEKIIISDYYYNITKSLGENLSIDNSQIKASYNKSYEAKIIAEGDYIIDSLVVTMGNQTIEADNVSGRIYIEKVTDNIEITATAKKLEIEVSEIIIGTTATATTSVEDKSQTVGTTLYINFDATLFGEECTITPEVPYAITTFGTYKFTATGTYEEKQVTKDIEVEVNKYQVYEIRTPDDLQNIRDNLSGTYYLMNDLDMSGYDFERMGGSYNQFKGTLDGQGYTISNLTINDTTEYGSSNYGTGLFRNITNATIKNVLFKDVNISSNNPHVGVIAGYSSGTNTIENVGVTGNLSGYSYVGSFIGSAGNSNFKNCYARTTLSSGNGYDTGGFVSNNSATITVENSYWSGTTTTTNRIGAFKPKATYYDKTPTITSCYYNKDLFNFEPSYTSETALTTEQFADGSNFTGWDFKENENDTDYTWYIDESGYPELHFNK